MGSSQECELLVCLFEVLSPVNMWSAVSLPTHTVPGQDLLS